MHEFGGGVDSCKAPSTAHLQPEVLQCVAVRCSVLQCVAVCCSVLQRLAGALNCSCAT